jgi:hypothetical protein
VTICVSVKVSEGLVLAADSTASVQGTFQDTKGQNTSGILKTYDHVRKLSHIKDYPIGTLTWGTALIASRSVESLIKEYEYSLPSLEEEYEKIQEQRMQGRVGYEKRYQYSVKDIAEGLFDHIKAYYANEFGNQDDKPPLGILVSGYSSGEFFPEQWVLNLATSEEMEQMRPDNNGKPSFGANWFGLTDAINRLHFGRDDQSINILANHFQVAPEEIKGLLKPLEYPVLFDGMPLQDAIDYATYLVNVVIGRFRFVIGAPLCGGEIDVSVITPNEFTWIKRKSWKVL